MCPTTFISAKKKEIKSKSMFAYLQPSKQDRDLFLFKNKHFRIFGEDGVIYQTEKPCRGGTLVNMVHSTKGRSYQPQVGDWVGVIETRMLTIVQVSSIGKIVDMHGPISKRTYDIMITQSDPLELASDRSIVCYVARKREAPLALGFIKDVPADTVVVPKQKALDTYEGFQEPEQDELKYQSLIDAAKQAKKDQRRAISRKRTLESSKTTKVAK